MRRTNLVKTILCGLIGTIAMGTAVFAGTVSREGYVRGKNYTNSYSGTLGKYAAGGEADTAATSAQNTSGSSRWFSVQVYEYNVETYRSNRKQVISDCVINGSSINAQIYSSSYDKTYGYDDEETRKGWHINIDQNTGHTSLAFGRLDFSTVLGKMMPSTHGIWR